MWIFFIYIFYYYCYFWCILVRYLFVIFYKLVLSKDIYVCLYVFYRFVFWSFCWVFGVGWYILFLFLVGIGRYRYGVYVFFFVCIGGWSWVGVFFSFIEFFFLLWGLEVYIELEVGVEIGRIVVFDLGRRVY